MSTSMGGGRGKHGDSDSEELIRDRPHGHGYHHRHGREWKSKTMPAASVEDPFQIHTMTEVKVERHNV